MKKLNREKGEKPSIGAKQMITYLEKYVYLNSQLYLLQET